MSRDFEPSNESGVLSTLIFGGDDEVCDWADGPRIIDMLEEVTSGGGGINGDDALAAGISAGPNSS